MAKVHTVTAFQGQRKCQNSPEGTYGVCGQPKAVHDTLDHPFMQVPLRCESCGNPINIGDPYKWVAPRAHRAAKGIKRNRHLTCPSWKSSELTSSPHLATIYAAQEDAEVSLAMLSVSSIDEVEDVAIQLEEIAGEFADQLQSAVESYEESASNIEDGFGHETYQSEELRQKSEDVQSWADEAEQHQVDRFDASDIEHLEDDDEEIEAALEDWLQGQIDNLTDIIYNSPV